MVLLLSQLPYLKIDFSKCIQLWWWNQNWLSEFNQSISNQSVGWLVGV